MGTRNNSATYVEKTDNTDIKNSPTSNMDALNNLCLHCGSRDHSLSDCNNLYMLPIDDRLLFLRGKGLCYGCLKRGHPKRDCRNKSVCQVCNYRHPTILHDGGISRKDIDGNVTDGRVASATGPVISMGSSFHMGAGEANCKMVIIPVKIRRKNSIKECVTYAFFDPGSNVSFISDELRHDLCVDGKRMNITVNTMGVPHNMSTYLINDIEISNIQGENTIDLPDIYTKDRIPVNHSQIPVSEDISRWEHLKGVVLPTVDAKIGLLLGNNIPDAYTPLEVKTGPRGSPHAARTLLGWIAWNVIRNTDPEPIG